MLKIGIIGGSGLDDPDFFKNPDILDIDTDYGKPSSLLLSGTIDDVETVILSRHGTKHQYCPTQVKMVLFIQPCPIPLMIICGQYCIKQQNT